MNNLKSYFKRQLNDFDSAAFVRIMKVFSALALLIILYGAVFSGFQIVDEFEHLHASWLVSIGKVPYHDFFEHHHPLLWYLSAPLLSLFYDNVIIFYVMRTISFCVSLLTAWYIYKIVLFFADRNASWLALALYLGNLITFYNFYQYRPDNFMNFCFIAGLYYWFVALKTDKLPPLIYSFLWFTFSVLFLQKISLLLVWVEIIMMGLIFIKKMKIKTITLAALPSLAVFCAFLVFLYTNGSLPMYLELNYRFNQAMIYYFERGSFWYRSIVPTVYSIALLVALYFFKKENLYFKIIALIYIGELIMRCFYFAPHPNYYTLLTMLSAIVLSVIITKLITKHKIMAMVLVVGMFLNLGQLFNRLDSSIERHNSYKHYQIAKYVHENSDKDDTLMNGYDMNFNIFRADVSYYWFGLDMLLPVMEAEYKMLEKPDVNALIIQYRPKFIYTRDYLDLRAYRAYGEKRYAQKFIPGIVQALYEPTPFANLAVLK